MEQIHVLVSVNATEEQVKALQNVDPRLVIHGGAGGIALLPAAGNDTQELSYPEWHPEIDLETLLQKVEVIIAFRVPDDVQQRAPKLRWVQYSSAGVDSLLTANLKNSDLIFTTISGVHPIPMGEFVLSMMLVFAKHWPRLMDQQRRKSWDKFLMDELHGHTLGVVGLGKIGREVARVGKCMGMRVVGVRRSTSPERVSEHVDQIFSRAQLHEALGMCDYVVGCLPRTGETEALFGEAAFRAMKPSAFFINVGRGKTQDEPALVRALQEGWIAGAGLDVFVEEPLPPDSPLWEMPNVIISPHMGADSPSYMERATGIFCENLRRYAAGEPLMNVVDHKLGY